MDVGAKKCFFERLATTDKWLAIVNDEVDGGFRDLAFGLDARRRAATWFRPTIMTRAAAAADGTPLPRRKRASTAGASPMAMARTVVVEASPPRPRWASLP